jgi:hypothetical protein
LRDENSGWAGPLVSRGAAATVGNVYEPYLALTAHLDILNDGCRTASLLPKAYSCRRGCSWIGVAVWDPIYRPYLNGTQIDSNASPKSAAGWRAIMISRSKTATWSLPIIALQPGLLPVAPALKLLHKIESDLTPNQHPA